MGQQRPHPRADRWLGELEEVLLRIHEIGTAGDVGKRRGFNAFVEELDRSRDLVWKIMPDDEWAKQREIALEYVSIWRVNR